MRSFGRGVIVFARQLSSVEHVLDRWRRGSDDRSVAVLRPTVTMGLEPHHRSQGPSQQGLVADLVMRSRPHSFCTSMISLPLLKRWSCLNMTELSMSHQMVGFLEIGYEPFSSALADPVPRWVREQYGLCSGGFNVDRSPGLGPYTTTSWVVANDRLKSLGWTSSVTNEQTFVEGTESPWWASSPQTTSGIALGGAVVGIVIALSQSSDGVRAFRLRASASHCTPMTARNDRYGHAITPVMRAEIRSRRLGGSAANTMRCSAEISAG